MTHTTTNLLTVFDLERLTKRKVSTWRKAIADGRVPIVRIGRSVRIPAEYVDGLIREGWVDPTEPTQEGETPSTQAGALS